jgi:hypothetical protein
VKDKAGREIQVGQYIVYGHALGRCAGLRYGVVLATAEDHIEIRGCDDDWHIRLLSRNSSLRFPKRILIVTGSQLPVEIVRAFDAWVLELSVEVLK